MRRTWTVAWVALGVVVAFFPIPAGRVYWLDVRQLTMGVSEWSVAFYWRHHSVVSVGRPVLVAAGALVAAAGWVVVWWWRDKGARPGGFGVEAIDY